MTQAITSPAAGTARPGRARLEGIDVARALALVGMLAVHFGPEDGEGLLGRFYSLAHGRASVLFVLVAGVGMALLSRRAEQIPSARMRLFCFAMLLLPLGLALQTLDHGVAVILQHYSAMFLLGAALIGLRRRTLLLIAVVVSIAGPLAYFSLGAVWPVLVERVPAQLGQPGWYLPLALLLSGPYPLIVWAAPVLWGLWLGGLPLGTAQIQRRLLMWGAVAAAGAIALSQVLTHTLGEPETPADGLQLVVMYAHSQMPLWLVQSIGLGAAALGLCLMAGRSFGRWLLPFAALGQFALTVYVVHLVALHFATDWLRYDEVIPAIASVSAFALVAMAVATVWQGMLGRGPLEWLLHATWTGVSRSLSPDAPVAAHGGDRENRALSADSR